MKKFLKVFLLILFIATLCVPAVYVNTIYGYIPIITTIVILIISGCYLLIIRKSLIVDTDNVNAECMRGEKVLISMRIKNKSILVCPKVKTDIFISDYFGNTDSNKSTTFSIDSKNSADFGFNVKMEHVGIYTVGIRNIKVYGLLGIFSVTVPFEESIAVTVLPVVSEIETFLADELLTDSPTAKNYTENDGFDYTGVREYALGDSMKKIHWKLSAHSFSYMTKINEIGRKSDMTIVLDTVSEKYDSDILLCINDALIEMSVSLINQAERKEIDYQILYADKDNQIDVSVPRGNQDYADLIRKISPISYMQDENTQDANSIIIEEMQYASRSANLCVCTSKISEQLLNTLVNVKNQQRSPILYYVIEPGASSTRRLEASGKLKVLEENNIYYEIISK